MYFDLIIAGFGGQGVMFIGNLLAHAAMLEDRKVTYMPVYGVEMRGGTANCTIVVSDEDIGSPNITNPIVSIVMNKPSLVKFGPRVKEDGLLLVNSSLIKPDEVEVKGPEIMMVPSIELAAEAGNDRLANMIFLGVLLGKTEVVSLETLKQALIETSGSTNEELLAINTRAIERGAAFGRTGS
ncbi:MAG: 2-oxoacid:acceptor oxidoreductase family protein [Deltaproteobacteria bacterium]|nr:2-oxoacid:acceptor oxidoreductase family protein [Deltaproteobacteria bacterium]MBW2052334.1 2-oxoacid:acceptor oxidoreductase family protein [Deltaproteobacteria bacterium]MBW2140213.1 2-oxoacid:acceptor oxidoreductase family protein [Deltaproteobacteria bacterium]MBW2323463.1 2-oxoacid:acceptor oxidoreductase family protein [Deltaproteobacteria bacterium]